MKQLGLRLGAAIPILLLVTLATFALVELMPGSPEAEILGPNASAEDYARVRDELGLDDPFVQRYVGWLADVVRGDFGRNLVPPVEEVGTKIARALPVSLELAVLALAIALATSVPAAMISAHNPGGRIDRLLSTTAFGLISVPTFLSGLLLILVLAVNWRIFPDRLWARPSEEGWIENLRFAFLPALTISLNEIAVFTRLLRNDLIATMQQDFILAARARGMSTWHIMVREALRPSSFSLVTLAGVSLGRLIGGTVIVERLFSLPGLGSLVVDAAARKDVAVVQAAVLIVALFYVVVNGSIDALYGALDPRTRRASH